MQQQLLQLIKSAQQDLQQLDLQAWQHKYLGKNALVNQLNRTLKDLDSDQRKEAGRALQNTKDQLQEMLPADDKNDAQQEYDFSSHIATIKGNKHPLERFQSEMVHTFNALGFEQHFGPDVESVYYNFDALNTHPCHPSRSKKDTFYIGENVLRTHTTAVQARILEGHKAPIKAFACGSVYRRDDDATHTPMFNQFDGVVIDEGLTVQHLKTFIEEIVRTLLPNAKDVRFRPSFFPFTYASAEVDVKLGDNWLEILGCGMIHPKIMKLLGEDQKHLSGFAFGFGVERFAMLKYNVTDIRHFYNNDVEFLSLF